MKRRMLSGLAVAAMVLTAATNLASGQQSRHPGGILFAMPDGSVRNVMMPGKGPQVRKARKSGSTDSGVYLKMELPPPQRRRPAK